MICENKSRWLQVEHSNQTAWVEGGGRVTMVLRDFFFFLLMENREEAGLEVGCVGCLAELGHCSRRRGHSKKL